MSLLICGVGLLALGIGAGQTGARPAAHSGTIHVPSHFFGVVPQEVRPPTVGGLQLMKAGKVGTLRFRVSWPQIQGVQDGEYDWRLLDALMSNLSPTGIRPLPFVIGTPAWFADDPYVPPLETVEARAGWTAFLQAVANRYGTNGTFWLDHPELTPDPIVDWQIWNEQNTPGHYKPEPKPRGYAKLLRISRKALTGVDPGAKVILGGMVGLKSKGIIGLKYLKRLYKIPRVKRSFDGVAFHPYSRGVKGVGLQLRQAHKLLVAHHDKKTGVWVTEVGWASTEGPSRLQAGEQGQKKLLKRSFEMLAAKRRAWNIKSVLWFSWKDRAEVQEGCTWCDTSGLFDVDGNPKPAWRAYTKFTGGDPTPEPPPPPGP